MFYGVRSLYLNTKIIKPKATLTDPGAEVQHAGRLVTTDINKQQALKVNPNPSLKCGQ